FRGLVRPVPVQRRVGIAAHPHDAFFAVADIAAVLVAKQDFVAGYAQAGSAELFLIGPVGKVDVQRFGGAQSFHDLKSSECLPAVEDVRRQDFGGGQRHAQRREVGGTSTFGLGQ